MRIVTTLDHTPSGRPVIRAKMNGKQKTTNYDHALSHDRNHGLAAAGVVLAWEPEGSGMTQTILDSIEDGKASHTTENGAKHVFEF